MSRTIKIPTKEARKIAQLESEKNELLLATIDLADTVAAQSVQLQEQSDALLDLANTLSEVMK